MKHGSHETKLHVHTQLLEIDWSRELGKKSLLDVSELSNILFP